MKETNQPTNQINPPTPQRNLRLAALVNDFGEVNLDVQLLGGLGASPSPHQQHHHDHQQQQHQQQQQQHLLGKAERVKGLEGGCMCCAPSLREGMRGEVWALLQQAGAAGGGLQPVGGDEGAVDYLVRPLLSWSFFPCVYTHLSHMPTPRHGTTRHTTQVIETSGVTDPEGVIAALDERFGKMTRARLDAVVTVVDADALAGEGEGGTGSSSVALARQLACADVVLLNKADLLSEEQ